jgi:hypothetical protein
MGMDDQGLHERVRAVLPFQIKGMSPFDDAPAVVVSAADNFDHFPLVLSDVTAPQIALRIEMDAPWIAKTVGPQLGPRAGDVEKRVVFRDRVFFAGCGMIDVDPQHARDQIADLLAGKIGVGIGGAVAGRRVQHAVGPESQVAAVVPV